MDIRLTCKRSTGLAVLPVVVMICNMILERGVGGAYKVSLVVSVIVAVGIGEVLTSLEVASAVAAVLIALCRVCNSGSVEGAVMDPAALNGSGESRALLLTLHTYTVLGNVLEGNISYLKALTDTLRVVCGLADEVKSPAVKGGIVADTLDGDVLTARHTSHKAVVAFGSAVVDRVISGKTCGSGYVADNTYNERSSVKSELADYISIGVSSAALGVQACANVLANRVKNVTDACNGGAVLACYGNGVLVLVGNIKNDCIFLKCTVIVVCANARGVVKVSIARAVVGIYGKCIGGERLGLVCCAADYGNYLDLIVACLKANRINTVACRAGADKVGIDLCPVAAACGSYVSVI